MPAAHETKFLHAILASGAEYDSLEKLAAAFGSFETAWRANEAALRGAGLNDERVRSIAAARERLNPDAEMRTLVAEGIAVVARSDPDYPKELLTIAQPPFGLYIKGRLARGIPHLAVVGTRKATAYGREATQKIIRELAYEINMVIVSGLAQGIDAEAHRSAITNGLPTIGVLGGGMDRASFFPPEHWSLAEEIAAKGGAVVSEYPPGAPALKHHFPARNRIIAGLSAGTLVVEAPEKSGALITARFAVEGGRDVFAVPSPLFSPNAIGTHRLIQDGAKLVTRAGDIIDELNLPRRARTDAIDSAMTDETERAILNLLKEPRSVDELKQAANLPTPAVITCLSSLELKGFIRPMGQNRFQRIT